MVFGEIRADGERADFASWKHSGVVFMDTTHLGAPLATGKVLEEFPVLVRLDKEWFPFGEVAEGGRDLRFTSGEGRTLAYEIESWDAASGRAAIWVRVPRLGGGERQPIRIHWGNSSALSESSGAKVFNASNGYLGVWHMTGAPLDATGNTQVKDTGTTSAPGLAGGARHFPGGAGLFLGEGLTHLPQGSGSHTTETWFRTLKPNTTLIAWGNEQAQGKVVMQYRSPSHVNMDCYFSDANVHGAGPIPTGEWVHAVHTYEKGEARLYVNGVLNATRTGRSSPLAIRSPAKLWMGGWYGNYEFVGDMEETRISGVVRSPEWIRMEYENLRPDHRLVGVLVQDGKALGVTPSEATVDEGGTVTFKAKAGGRHKLFWCRVEDGVERVVGIDQFQHVFDAGRVTGSKQTMLRFKAVGGDGETVLDIPITVRERIPDPVFTLKAPSRWDGRSRIELVPQIKNQSSMDAVGVGKWNVRWKLSGPAVVEETATNRLVLTRAQGSGDLVVTATLENGGKPVTATATIRVREPRTDSWIARVPAAGERPEDNQFYARDDRGGAAVVWNGTADGHPDRVFLRVSAGDQVVGVAQARPGADGQHRLSVRIRPALVEYRVEMGTIERGVERIVGTATNVVCGDAYVLQGQSNTVATDWGTNQPTFHSEWIRTFGSMAGGPEPRIRWGEAVHRGRRTEAYQIGYWGMELGRRLVEAHQVPVCILNGAVGGTRIDQHQRDALNPENSDTIYGRLLHRVREARLTHGIRAVLWHQGENDQGADGPDGGFGWENYRENFIRLAGAWKRDFPNVQNYYVFQIWPKSCAMGVDGSDNRLREVQRSLPTAFSRLRVMSTLGVEPPGGCHFPAEGYAEFARLIFPLIEQDQYGVRYDHPVTPPNLRSVRFADARRDRIRLEFDQPVRWTPALVSEFRLDGVAGKVASGEGEGAVVWLQLKAPTDAKRLTYLDSAAWSQARLLRGENGIAALTFCEVPIEAAKPGAR